jgi:DNA-binding NtrC family response regulator
MPQSVVLVVDDDDAVRSSLSLLLRQAGYGVITAASPAEAVEVLTGSTDVSLVLQDMNFSRQTTGEEGLALLRQIREQHSSLPVVLITAWGSIPLAVEGMKAGANDFVTKPWTHEEILQTIQTCLGLAQTQGVDSTNTAPDREQLDKDYDFSTLVGRDPALLRVLEVIGKVADTDASVLILGESGTGKELIAEAIWRNSQRKKGNFVKVNLGGITPTLFESEMFGHVAGAFTDAKTDRTGRFELAHSGTLFLDEIGELERTNQVKLLRVLQDRTFERVGSSKSKTVDVRLICATNRNITAQLEDGSFREDLYYRINLITVTLPPLRERTDDIPLLVNHFLSSVAARYKQAVKTVDAAAYKWLQARPWRGNVRELQQLIERTLLLTSGEIIKVADLEQAVAMQAPGVKAPRLPEPGSMTLDELEHAMILAALDRYSGQVVRAAEALGLSRSALYRRLEKHGIEI